jgi:hypothetical protein
VTLDAIDPEVIEPLDQASAKRLDQRIRLLVGTINDNIDKLTELVDEAKHGQVHITLGFSSWTAYVKNVFTVNVRLERDQRRELVSYLSGEGMPQRAIADVVGVGVGTVNRDLDAAAPVPDGTPEPITGLDGKTYRTFPRKGRGNSKMQLRGLENIGSSLTSMANILEMIFDGSFEKTCTPEIAKDYAASFRAGLQRINRVVRLLEADGNDRKGGA